MTKALISSITHDHRRRRSRRSISDSQSSVTGQIESSGCRIVRLLRYDSEAKGTQLSSQLWYKDTCTHMDAVEIADTLQI